jgi:hypothetical protein
MGEITEKIIELVAECDSSGRVVKIIERLSHRHRKRSR